MLPHYCGSIYYLTPPVRVGGVCLYGGGAVSFADEFHELVLRNRL